MYAIGTSPNKLISIENICLFSNNKTVSKYIIIQYGIIQSECTLFNNKCDAEEILKDMKDENNTVTFKNGNIFAGILEELDEPEPKIEDLKIYRVNIEEVE